MIEREIINAAAIVGLVALWVMLTWENRQHGE